MRIPPIFFCAIGAIMVAFGITRAFVLGRRRPEREIGDDTPEKAKARRNHLVFGVVHVVMGIFLILLTTGVIPSRVAGP
ncbi:MAG TPA: hypothetical protein VHJ20_18160 [Polyangia bacterium]|nr:hypothetical protein [Polyangia bacterium]